MGCLPVGLRGFAAAPLGRPSSSNMIQRGREGEGEWYAESYNARRERPYRRDGMQWRRRRGAKTATALRANEREGRWTGCARVDSALVGCLVGVVSFRFVFNLLFVCLYCVSSSSLFFVLLLLSVAVLSSRPTGSVGRLFGGSPVGGRCACLDWGNGPSLNTQTK